MKKIIAIALGVMLLAGCAAPAAKSSGGTKTGIGSVVSIAKSKDATSSAKGLAQVDSIVAAVTIDANGKILAVDLDSIQTKIEFDAAGKVTTDKTVPGQTKTELGDKYGMKAQSKLGKEWYEEAAELEKWMVGKTVDQVKAMKTKKVDDSHPNVPDVPELTSKVTISVQDYIAAVEKAAKNAK